MAKAPCITCVQYRGRVQYCGVLSTVGDMIHVGEYHDKCGDILSTVGVQYRGGYHK